MFSRNININKNKNNEQIYACYTYPNNGTASDRDKIKSLVDCGILIEGVMYPVTNINVEDSITRITINVPFLGNIFKIDNLNSCSFEFFKENSNKRNDPEPYDIYTEYYQTFSL